MIDAMMLFSQPNINVGLTFTDGFGLYPQGAWKIDASEEQIVYMPLGSTAVMKVSGVTIGKGFHWQQNRDYEYRGRFVVRRVEGGKSVLINNLPLEEYLRCVISSEMSQEAPPEFLKAHAIISRSWALRKITKATERLSEGKVNTPQTIITWQESDAHKYFDVCSDDHCQRYQGIAHCNEQVAEAIAATSGLVLMHQGEIADARFSKCCGGTTELFSTCWADSDLPYLTPIADPYCSPHYIRSHGLLPAVTKALKDYDRTTDYYEWTETVDASLVRANLKAVFGIDKGPVESLQITQTGASGRAKQLLVSCQNGSVSIGKELAIRRLLSPTHLYSSLFSIEPREGGFTLRGKGWGHGVGLCQIGAAAMAVEGFSAQEILQFYYPGTELKKAY